MTSLTKQLVSQHGAQGPRPPCSPALSSMHSLGLHLTQPSLQNSPSPWAPKWPSAPPTPHPVLRAWVTLQGNQVYTLTRAHKLICHVGLPFFQSPSP